MEVLAIQTKLLKVSMGALKGVLLAGGAAFAVGGIATAFAFSSLVEYEQALRKAGAIGELTASQVETLNQLILDAAVAWGLSSQNIAEGVLELTKAGIAFEDFAQLIDLFAQASIANIVDFNEVVQIAVVVMRAFKFSAEELPLRFDQMQKAANLALVDFEDFNEVLKFTAALVNLTGISFEELIAATATISNLGVQSGLTGRGINRMLTNIIQNREGLQAWINTLVTGVEVVKDGKVNLTGMIGALEGVGINIDALEGLLEEFSIVGARTFAQLLLSSEEYEMNLVDIKNASGDMLRVAEISVQSLAAMWTQVQEIFLSIFREDPQFIENLAEVLTILRDVVEENKESFRELFLTLIESFVEQLPSLVGLVTNLLEVMVQLLPTINILSGMFATMLSLITLIDPKFLAMIASVLIFSKLLLGPAMMGITTYTRGMSTLGATTFVSQRRIMSMRQAMVVAQSAMIAATFTMAALTAQSLEQQLVFSALAGITWALVGAQIALALARTGAMSGPLSFLTVPAVAALLFGLIGGVGTFIAAQSTSFKHGSPFLTEDTFAMLHRGEKVLTADQSTFFSGGMHGGEININLFDSSGEDVMSELDKFMR